MVLGLAVPMFGQHFHNAALTNLSSATLTNDPPEFFSQNFQAGDLFVNGLEVPRSNTVDLSTVPFRLIRQVQKRSNVAYVEP